MFGMTFVSLAALFAERARFPNMAIEERKGKRGSMHKFGACSLLLSVIVNFIASVSYSLCFLSYTQCFLPVRTKTGMLTTAIGRRLHF